VFLIKNKILAIMFMLMVFIGQSAAATNDSCHMSAMDQNNHLSSHTTRHMTQNIAPHNRLSDSATPSSLDDCCAPDCNCPMGGCTFALLLASPHHVWEVIGLQKMGDRPFLVTRQSPTTLYRPPISL